MSGAPARVLRLDTLPVKKKCHIGGYCHHLSVVDGYLSEYASSTKPNLGTLSKSNLSNLKTSDAGMLCIVRNHGGQKM